MEESDEDDLGLLEASDEEAASGDRCMYTCIGALLVCLTVTSSFPALVLPFATSVGLSIAVLVVAQRRHNDNEANPKKVWGLPLALFVGLLAKLTALAVGICLFLLLRAAGFDLANPHPNVPLSMGELLVRIATVSVVLIAVVEEALKMSYLLSFDDAEDDAAMDSSHSSVHSRFADRLGLYHPRGLVLLAIAMSLGGSGFFILDALYVSDGLLPLPYQLAIAVLDVCTNIATGTIVGVGIAERLFYPHLQRESASSFGWKVFAPAVALRAVFHAAYMLPLRRRSFAKEIAQVRHLFHIMSGVLYKRSHDLPAIVIHEWLALVWLGVALIVGVGVFVSWTRFQELCALDEASGDRGPERTGLLAGHDEL